jgi:outer membrane protein assembly factor BamA
LGAGFSSAEKLALSFSIKQENAFGSGNYLGIEVNTSNTTAPVVFNSVDPYFTRDGISRTIDLYYRSSKPYEQQGGNYELVTTGAGLRFGIPFSELDTVFFGGSVERIEIKPGTNIPAVYLDYAAASALPARPCRSPSAGHATTATVASCPPGGASSAWRANWAWPATHATSAVTTKSSSTWL